MSSQYSVSLLCMFFLSSVARAGTENSPNLSVYCYLWNCQCTLRKLIYQAVACQLGLLSGVNLVVIYWLMWFSSIQYNQGFKMKLDIADIH